MGRLMADCAAGAEATLVLGWLVFVGELFDIPVHGCNCTLAQAVSNTAELTAVSLRMR